MKPPTQIEAKSQNPKALEPESPAVESGAMGTRGGNDGGGWLGGSVSHWGGPWLASSRKEKNRVASIRPENPSF